MSILFIKIICKQSIVILNTISMLLGKDKSVLLPRALHTIYSCIYPLSFRLVPLSRGRKKTKIGCVYLLMRLNNDHRLSVHDKSLVARSTEVEINVAAVFNYSRFTIAFLQSSCEILSVLFCIICNYFSIHSEDT